MFSSSSPRSRRLAPRRKRAATPTLGVTAFFALCIYSLTFNIKLHKEADNVTLRSESDVAPVPVQTSNATITITLSKKPENVSSVENSDSNREEDKQASSTVAAEGSKINSVRSIFTEPMNFKEFEINKQRRKYNPDVCQLFDFAVTGFAKCGTTSTHAWIDAHNDTRVAKGEQWNFFRNPMVAAANIQKKTIKNENAYYIDPKTEEKKKEETFEHFRFQHLTILYH